LGNNKKVRLRAGFVKGVLALRAGPRANVIVDSATES